MKKSVQLINPIRHDRRGHKKSRRDEELIKKAEHLSIVKWHISEYFITKRVMANCIRYASIRYANDFSKRAI